MIKIFPTQFFFFFKHATERKTIDVKTGAFDVTGWIALTELRSGDVVEVSTFVRVAGKRRRLARTRLDNAELVPFADVARGLNYLSGNDIRVQIRQPVPTNQSNKKIGIGYQFIVESQ